MADRGMARLLMGVALYLVFCAVLAARERAMSWSPGGPLPGRAEPGRPGGIPKIIHQMYGTQVLPQEWAEVPAAWKHHHPDYQYILWTDDTLRNLIANDYPWLLPTYDGYPYDTQRWDASRYALLHKCVACWPTACPQLTVAGCGSHGPP
jgi:hypothetical protein